MSLRDCNLSVYSQWYFGKSNATKKQKKTDCCECSKLEFYYSPTDGIIFFFSVHETETVTVEAKTINIERTLLVVTLVGTLLVLFCFLGLWLMRLSCSDHNSEWTFSHSFFSSIHSFIHFYILFFLLIVIFNGNISSFVFIPLKRRRGGG